MGSISSSDAHDIPRRRVLQSLALAFAAPPLFAACSSGSNDAVSTVLDSAADEADDSGLSLTPADSGVDETTTSTDADQGAQSPVSGEQVEASSGTTSSIGFTYLDTGAPGTLGDFGGKPTVLNFFASWCPPCRQEMPDFEEAHLKYKDQVNFVGLATNDEDGAAQELVTETGVTYPIGTDQNQDAYFALGGIAMPTTIFIDANGEVVDTWFGILIPADLDVLIQGLL